jgi:hypothetical protein
MNCQEWINEQVRREEIARRERNARRYASERAGIEEQERAAQDKTAQPHSQTTPHSAKVTAGNIESATLANGAYPGIPVVDNVVNDFVPIDGRKCR